MYQSKETYILTKQFIYILSEDIKWYKVVFSFTTGLYIQSFYATSSPDFQPNFILLKAYY